MSFRVSLDASRAGQAFEAFRAFNEARLQRAMLAGTHRAAQRLKTRVRTDMQAAGLGRLGNAIDASSDQERGRGVHPQPRGFSASGMLFVRSGSERTRGAIEAYTAAANIRPQRGRWLWIPSDDIKRVVGKGTERRRLTPGNWSASGMDRRVGPLVLVRSVNGNPLLVVKDASVSLSGKRDSAKGRTKTGKLRKGQTARDFLVAFIGIPSTSRAARIDIAALHQQAMAVLPDLIATELRRS